CTTVNFPYDW
nr:immunoglobulin heavy chain junction region [Macaca mulatta]